MLGLALLLILLAAQAEAHGALPGGGGFYSGALHPFVAPEHLLVLLSGGLILGRDGRRRPVWALAIGLVAGLWSGLLIPGLQASLLGLTLGFGAILAWQARLPEWALAGLLLAAGAGIGMETDLPALNLRMASLGVGVSVFLIIMNAFALGAAVSGGRGAIVLQVAGAWMFAVAVMVLALTLRGLA